MAAGLKHGFQTVGADVERRVEARVTPDRTQWQRLALLRPGQEVEVMNLSSGGALLESAARMNPGARAELQLFGAVRWQVRGRIGRCRVLRLAPICYEAAIVFEERLELVAAGQAGSCFP